MNLKNLMKEMNKVKKLGDDIPVVYMYDSLAETSVVEIDEIKLIYVNDNIIDDFVKNKVSDILSLDAKSTKTEGYSPCIILTEKLNDN